jgi:hypothetical protein
VRLLTPSLVLQSLSLQRFELPSASYAALALLPACLQDVSLARLSPNIVLRHESHGCNQITCLVSRPLRCRIGCLKFKEWPQRRAKQVSASSSLSHWLCCVTLGMLSRDFVVSKYYCCESYLPSSATASMTEAGSLRMLLSIFCRNTCIFGFVFLPT